MKDEKGKFRFLEHTGDVKFQSYGSSLEKAFENAALALKQVIAGKIRVKNKIKNSFAIEGKDEKAKLYSFLEEFIYLLDAEDFILSSIKVKIKDNELEAEVWGDKASNYEITNDVKAVTYNEMFVKKEKNKYIVQVVLDV